MEEEKKRRTVKLIGVGLPLAIALGLSVFFFWQWERTRRPPDLTDTLAEEAMPAVEGVADDPASDAGEATSATPAAEPETKTPSDAKALEGIYSFAVRNGAGISGLAARFGGDIVASVEGATIVETSNAEETSYDESILVSFIEDTAEAERIAELLEISLGDLPQGELEPKADFLVMVGKDQR